MNLAIIQARTGSSRLPGKILMPLGDKPMLHQIVNRVSAAKTVDKIVVATTCEKGDDIVETLCEEIGVFCYRGSVDDVLDRYYKVSNLFHPDNIIRITADCPLIDPNVIDKVVSIHNKNRYEYTSNTMEETYPDGLDVEVFCFSALEEAWLKADLLSEREHVTPYIKNKGSFRRGSVTITPSLGDKRWTVDTDRDYEFISLIYKDLYRGDEIFYMEDVLLWLDKHKHLEEINNGIIRNEGYKKSLLNDRIVK